MTTVIVGDAGRIVAPVQQVTGVPVTLVSPEGDPLTPPSS